MSLTDWPKVGAFEKLYLDKLVHVAMYGMLCFLLLRAIFRQYQSGKLSASEIILSILFCAGIGIAIEFLQPVLTMYRQFEWADMVADGIGSIAGFYMFSLLLKWKLFGLHAS